MREPIVKIVAALELAERELRFHANRLEKRAANHPDGDGAHVRDIAHLYSESARGCSVLANYQRGRLRAAGEEKPDGSVHAHTDG